MPDYKDMYLHLFRASERAIEQLIAAQRACEERYLSGQEPEQTLISLPEEAT